jgi:hypothetical protein
MSIPAGHSTRASWSSGTQLLDQRLPALGTGDKPDVGQVGIQRSADGLQLALAMRGDDEPEIALADLRRAVADRCDVEVELRTEPLDGGSDRLGADDAHTWGRQRRLEKDLDRTAGQAGVLHRHCTVLLCTGLHIVAHLRQDAQE